MKGKGSASLLTLLVLLAAPAAWAGNGHTLHGIGAVNSSMGGAGVALPTEPLGALALNPALLAKLPGSQFAFSAEYNNPSNAVSSQVGPFSGRTEDAGDTVLIPAFGWTHQAKSGRFAYGMGFLGLAGFGADYPQDPGNPILAPQPFGFGRFYASYSLLKVPVALAWQINDSLALGVSLDTALASLTADPAGFATPDCSGPAGPCFFPRVANDSAWGFGASLGLYYQFNPAWAFGLSYHSEIDFEDFEWNSAHANPGLPNFGTRRDIALQINMPAVLVAGFGWTPNDRLGIALDGKMLSYEDTEGFSDVLGYEDITVIELGVQFKATERFTLRGGYNAGDNPIPDERAFFTVATPAVFEDRFAVGLGFQVNDALQLNAGYYHVFKNEITGPFFSPAGPVPGTSVTTEMEMDSVLVTFNFALQ